MSVRVRMAPSPTGSLHIGNARTALFNYLFAKQQKGTYIVRIEDTDYERSTKESEHAILFDMRWLQLPWDEGVEVGGPYEPYRQSERLGRYTEVAQQLLDSGDAYYCFCTKEELDKKREIAEQNKKAYRYDGKCRHLSKDEIEQKIASGAEKTIRFAIHKESITIKDVIKGTVNFQTDAFGDFVIVRPSGVPIYNFTVVVDDMDMKITHVIRGDDHLSNTPKHALIFEALKFPVPVFVHIPMVLGADRSKMSKRHGDTSVAQFREKGYLPEALCNYIALLSWSDGTEQEFFTIDELIEKFNLDKVSSSASVFDFDKLRWMNAHYVKQMSESDYLAMAREFAVKGGAVTEADVKSDAKRIDTILLAVRDSIVIFSDVADAMHVFFEQRELNQEAIDAISTDDGKKVVLAFREKLNGRSSISDEEYKAVIKELQKELGVKGKGLFMPVRVAITGEVHGPDMQLIVSLTKFEDIIARVDNVINKFIK